MRFIPLAIIASVLFFCFCACKKNRSDSPAQYADYTQLKTGNYWVYQEFEMDTFGNTTPLAIYDSCYIEKDTVINNQTYFVLVGPYPLSGNTPLVYQFLRDSLDYTVDNNGTIIFSSSHLGVVFNSDSDAYGSVSFEMMDSSTIITVPAGTFSTLAYMQTNKLSPVMEPRAVTRHRYTRYAKNVGIVSETLEFYETDPTYTERRLVRYHLN